MQALRISYRVSELPREVRFVCIATLSDEPLTEIADDARYLFRWLVDEGLDPADEAVFRVGMVRVDGRPLKRATLRKTTIGGCPAAEYRYGLTAEQRGLGSHHVEFSVTVRKYLGEDRHIRLQAQLFRPVTDAEYRLTVGPGIGAKSIDTQISTVSRLGPVDQFGCGPTFPGVFGHVAAHAIFTTPLQAGSNVAFILDRGPRTT